MTLQVTLYRDITQKVLVAPRAMEGFSRDAGWSWISPELLQSPHMQQAGITAQCEGLKGNAYEVREVLPRTYLLLTTGAGWQVVSEYLEDLQRLFGGPRRESWPRGSDQGFLTQSLPIFRQQEGYRQPSMVFEIEIQVFGPNYWKSDVDRSVDELWETKIAMRANHTLSHAELAQDLTAVQARVGACQAVGQKIEAFLSSGIPLSRQAAFESREG